MPPAAVSQPSGGPVGRWLSDSRACGLLCFWGWAMGAPRDVARPLPAPSKRSFVWQVRVSPFLPRNSMAATAPRVFPRPPTVPSLTGSPPLPMTLSGAPVTLPTPRSAACSVSLGARFRPQRGSGRECSQAWSGFSCHRRQACSAPCSLCLPRLAQSHSPLPPGF